MTQGEHPGRPLRLLVADDYPDARGSLALVLRLLGHQVCEAADGQEAVQLACAFRPEAVFLDIGMPQLDGYDVVRLLRRTPGLERILLVAVTGYVTAADIRACREAGF